MGKVNPVFEADARPEAASSRCLGHACDGSGPTVVITAGLHGNEPAGVFAASEVMHTLERVRPRLRGKVMAFRGNRLALERRERYLTRDLNRRWHDAHLDRLAAAPLEELRYEDREQRELYDVFTSIERQGRPVIFVDLHTTSGPSEPFVCVGATGRSRQLARALPVSAVVGLEQKLEGTLLSWCIARGHAALSFEAGQHDDPATLRRHVAAVFTLLVAARVLDPSDVPRGQPTLRETLGETSARPRVVEVRHRHVVAEGDDFEMVGRFESFEPIVAGQIVARDRRGPVLSPEAGLLLMPRYQAQGEDGFFVARELSPEGK